VTHQTTSDIDPARLALTERGINWLAQFKPEDRDNAERLLRSLTLVSHSAFERGLLAVIERRATVIEGPVALFATREIDPTISYFEQATNREEPQKLGAINAVGAGRDLGSEARIAVLIRNQAKGSSDKFLNHPSIAEMREAKVRAIFVLDDILGSGRRTAKFLQAMWQSSTIRSWHSLHLIRFEVIAYTATTFGQATVQKSKGKPNVYIERDCTVFTEMPWPKRIKTEIIELCREYGRKTSRRSMALGYKNTMGMVVFQHGCPNNAPAILWAPETNRSLWQSLFPDRSVMSAEASAFPPEIAGRDPTLVLCEVGQRRLAVSGCLSRRGPLGDTILLIIALAARGVRRRSALGYATGLSAQDCDRVLARCVRWGFLTLTYRLTSAGKAELDYARKLTASVNKVPPIGDEVYYPGQLRGPRGG